MFSCLSQGLEVLPDMHVVVVGTQLIPKGEVMALQQTRREQKAKVCRIPKMSRAVHKVKHGV